MEASGTIQGEGDLCQRRDHQAQGKENKIEGQGDVVLCGSILYIVVHVLETGYQVFLPWFNSAQTTGPYLVTAAAGGDLMYIY